MPERAIALWYLGVMTIGTTHDKNAVGKCPINSIVFIISRSGGCRACYYYIASSRRFSHSIYFGGFY